MLELLVPLGSFEGYSTLYSMLHREKKYAQAKATGLHGRDEVDDKKQAVT